MCVVGVCLTLFNHLFPLTDVMAVCIQVIHTSDPGLPADQVVRGGTFPTQVSPILKFLELGAFLPVNVHQGKNQQGLNSMMVSSSFESSTRCRPALCCDKAFVVYLEFFLSVSFLQDGR